MNTYLSAKNKAEKPKANLEYSKFRIKNVSLKKRIWIRSQYTCPSHEYVRKFNAIFVLLACPT